MRAEVPHLKRPPSEYVREHFWVTTQPIDEPDEPSDLLPTSIMDRQRPIMFSTDYPHWDFDDPAPGAPSSRSRPRRGRMICSGQRAGAVRAVDEPPRRGDDRRDRAGRPRKIVEIDGPLDRRLQRRRRVLRAAQPLPAPGRAAVRGRRWSAWSSSDGPGEYRVTAPGRVPALPLARLGVRHPHRPVRGDPQDHEGPELQGPGGAGRRAAKGPTSPQTSGDGRGGLTWSIDL